MKKSNERKIEEELSIVIRCAYEVDRLKRCISTIPPNIEVIVSTARNSQITKLVFPKERNIKIVTHKYGNWSNAAETGIENTTKNNLIITDGDSYFSPKSLYLINNALSKGHIVVKPKVVFLKNGSFISSIISNIRTHQHEYKAKAFTPGLGIKKKELINLIDVNKEHLYNRKIQYADDGNLNKQIYEKNIPIFILKKAVVYHDPVSLKHECKTAFILGKGNRQADKGGNPFLLFIKREFSYKALVFYKLSLMRFGLTTAISLLFWRGIYYLGYFQPTNES